MNFESPAEKPRKASITEAGAFATALLASIGSLDSHPAQALEISPNTSWQTGMQQNIRKSVLEDKTERATTYVAFTDGTSTWLQPTAGKSRGVDIDVEEFNSQIVAMRSSKQISVTCQIHTHPSEGYREQLKAFPGMAERIPIPPSEKDITAAGLGRKNFVAGDGNSRPMQFAAADAEHIWYFLQVRNQKLDLKKFDQAYRAFVQRSVEPNFVFERELPKLQVAYRNYLGGEVRAVSYGSLQNEPPCAGIDMKQNSSSKK